MTCLVGPYFVPGSVPKEGRGEERRGGEEREGEGRGEGDFKILRKIQISLNT
jgi:hypothetical protein